MTNQEIPEAAVEAALLALFPNDAEVQGFKRSVWLPTISTILEAASAHMLAGAWEQGWTAREDLHAYDVWGGEGEEPDSSNPYRPTP